MKPVPYWLTGLFVLQIAVAGLLYFQSEQQQAGQKPVPLLGLTAADITQLRLTEGDQRIQLERQGDRWRLSMLSEGAADNPAEVLPANDTLVTGLLVKLQALTTSWPVAQTQSAQQRFEVAESLYQRKLELTTDTGSQTLYLGTSPGFRKLHVRLKDQEEIYALSLNLYEMPAELDYWLDKRLLASQALTEIESTNVKLVLNQAAEASKAKVSQANASIANASETQAKDKPTVLWQFAEGEGEGEVDQDQAKTLASRLQNLQVKGVVTTAVPETLDWVSIKAQSETTKYEWKLAQQQDQHYIQRVDQKGIFTVDAATYEALTAIRKTRLVKAEKIKAEKIKAEKIKAEKIKAEGVEAEQVEAPDNLVESEF
jgi:hypothetical protein